MGDDDAVAALYLASEDALASCFLRVEHLGRSTKLPYRRVYTSCLYHASVLGNIAEEHSQATILGVSVLERAYATILAVYVKRLPLCILTAHLCRELASRSTAIYTIGLCRNTVAGDVVRSHSLSQCHSVNTLGVTVNQSATVKLVQDAEDATCAVALLYAILLCVRRELAQARHVSA